VGCGTWNHLENSQVSGLTIYSQSPWAGTVGGGAGGGDGGGGGPPPPPPPPPPPGPPRSPRSQPTFAAHVRGLWAVCVGLWDVRELRAKKRTAHAHGVSSPQPTYTPSAHAAARHGVQRTVVPRGVQLFTPHTHACLIEQAGAP
jgi:hypothetical protein